MTFTTYAFNLFLIAGINESDIIEADGLFSDEVKTLINENITREDLDAWAAYLRALLVNLTK